MVSPGRVPSTSASFAESTSPSGGKLSGRSSRSTMRRSSLPARGCRWRPVAYRCSKRRRAAIRRPVSTRSTPGSAARSRVALHGRPRLVELDQQVLAHRAAEKDPDDLVERVDRVLPDHEQRSRESDRQRGERRAQRPPFEVAQHHAQRRRHEPLQPDPLDEQRPERGGAPPAGRIASAGASASARRTANSAPPSAVARPVITTPASRSPVRANTSSGK